MDLGLAREKLERDPEAAAALVESAHEEAKVALAELRELVRGVHPVVLTDRGLDAALSALAARSPMPVSLDVARAQQAWVRVARRGDALEVEVRDDGDGGATVAAGGGLAGLARRVEALDGTFTVESAPGEGTIVRAELPCAS
jgi:signal transduction histidine kinase